MDGAASLAILAACAVAVLLLVRGVLRARSRTQERSEVGGPEPSRSTPAEVHRPMVPSGTARPVNDRFGNADGLEVPADIAGRCIADLEMEYADADGVLTERRVLILTLDGTANEDGTILCTGPGSLDTREHYAARLRLASRRAARASSGLRKPFFSISHSAL